MGRPLEALDVIVYTHEGTRARPVFTVSQWQVGGTAILELRLVLAVLSVSTHVVAQ